MVTRAGGARVAGAARHGTGGGSDTGGRTRRHHPLRQSTPAYGVSRPGAVRALTRRQGRITKAGNGAARRMLIEAAWSYRFPARISRELLLRQEGLARSIRDTAWKAQERLCRRYRKLARAGKPPTVVTTAIARELAGFVWAIANQVEFLRRVNPPELMLDTIGSRDHQPARNTSKAGHVRRHGHGQENPRIHYQPDLSDAGC